MIVLKMFKVSQIRLTNLFVQIFSIEYWNKMKFKRQNQQKINKKDQKYFLDVQVFNIIYKTKHLHSKKIYLHLDHKMKKKTFLQRKLPYIKLKTYKKIFLSLVNHHHLNKVLEAIFFFIKVDHQDQNILQFF